MKQYEDILGDLLAMCEKMFPEYKKKVEETARTLFAEYCEAEKEKPKEIRMHTIGLIFPCIAFYKAVIEVTNQKEKAYTMIAEYFADRSKATAKKLQKLCRIPFVYKIVPRIMIAVIHRGFGEKSGFEMVDYNAKKKSCRVDMIKCPYFSICSMQGCPELTTAFCNADDVAYGNMHPKLSWERSKTLGRGNDCCDFILKIKE